MQSLENLIGWGQSALKYTSNCTGTSTWKLGARNFALHCTGIKKENKKEKQKETRSRC